MGYLSKYLRYLEYLEYLCQVGLCTFSKAHGHHLVRPSSAPVLLLHGVPPFCESVTGVCSAASALGPYKHASHPGDTLPAASQGCAWLAHHQRAHAQKNKRGGGKHGGNGLDEIDPRKIIGSTSVVVFQGAVAYGVGVTEAAGIESEALGGHRSRLANSWPGARSRGTVRAKGRGLGPGTFGLPISALASHHVTVSVSYSTPTLLQVEEGVIPWVCKRHREGDQRKKSCGCVCSLAAVELLHCRCRHS